MDHTAHAAEEKGQAVSLIEDPEFRQLIPPVTKEEFEELERSILEDGCRDAIVIWKRHGIIIGAFVGLINSVLLPFVARPGHPYLWWGFGLAFMPISVFIGLLNQSLLPDICDLDELRYGERREGLFSAVWTFFGKLQTSLFAVVGMWLLSWSGYKEAAKEHQTFETVYRMLWIGFTPNILFHVTALITVFFIPITPQLMAKVRAELALRKTHSGQG